MTTKVNWKTSKILKVFGTTIKEGTFTGCEPDGTGSIKKSDPTTFTPDVIARIYENIETHVPFVITHGESKRPIGYAYKFGVSDTLDDIKYNGFIFDEEALRKISVEGYDSISPEIEEIRDKDTGELIDVKLVRLAFVQNPAISGTDVSMEQIYFSTGTPNSKDDNKMTAEPTQSQSVTTTQTQPVTTTNVQVPQEDIDEPITGTKVPDINTMFDAIKPVAPKNEPAPDVSADIADIRTKLEKEIARNEKLMGERLSEIVSEMKQLGVDDPSSIVKGLPTENKIEVLNKLKNTLVKTKPIVQTTTSGTMDTEPKKTEEAALESVLSELGVSKEYYDKLVNKQ